MHVLGLCTAVAVGAVIAVNASVMLVSPKHWFGLPNWIFLKGSLTQSRYGRGWGAIEVRLAGAIMLGTIGWVLYDAFVK